MSPDLAPSPVAAVAHGAAFAAVTAPGTGAASAHLTLHGYPALWLAGQRTPMKLKHGHALLAILSRARGPLGRTYLASLLWGDGSAQALRSRLRRLAYQTQQIAKMALFDGDVDALALRPGVSSDLGRTCAALARLNAALIGERTGQRTIERRLTPRPQATWSAAGPAAVTDFADRAIPIDANTLSALAQPLLAPQASGVLEGFTLGHEAFDAWVEQEQRSHVAALTRTLERLAARAIELHAGELAESAAVTLLRLDTCNETGHRARMATRALHGDAAGVENAYFDCASALREELGLAPSPALEAGYAQAQQLLRRAVLAA
jgi:DNA-binding SARP family transcriptional activator